MNARKYGRTPGEKAFDRCFLPLAAVSVLGVVVGIIEWMSDRADKHVTEATIGNALGPAPIPHSGWLVWFPFALGVLLAVLWVRAVVSLVAA